MDLACLLSKSLFVQSSFGVLRKLFRLTTVFSGSNRMRQGGVKYCGTDNEAWFLARLKTSTQLQYGDAHTIRITL